MGGRKVGNSVDEEEDKEGWVTLYSLVTFGPENENSSRTSFHEAVSAEQLVSYRHTCPLPIWLYALSLRSLLLPHFPLFLSHFTAPFIDISLP